MEENQASINNKIAALGVNRSVVSERYGVSRSAFYTNIKRYDEGRYDEIAPGLLSFFRFIDEKAQTKTDVLDYLNRSYYPSVDQNFSLKAVDGIHCEFDPRMVDDDPGEKFDFEMSYRSVDSATRVIDSAYAYLSKNHPDSYIQNDDGRPRFRYQSPGFDDNLAGRLMDSMSLLGILNNIANDHALVDTGINNINMAKEYIKAAYKDLRTILDDPVNLDENSLLAKISACNRIHDFENASRLQWYVGIVIYNPNDRPLDQFALTVYKIHAESESDASAFISNNLRNHIRSTSYHWETLGPYVLESTADKVQKYISADWNVSVCPPGKYADMSIALDWFERIKTNRILKRGLL